MIPCHQIQSLTIFRLDDGMSRVLVSNTQLFQQREFIKGIISIGIPDPIKPLHGGHVETIKRIKKSQCSAHATSPPVDRQVWEALEMLDTDSRPFGFRQCEPEHPFVILI